MDLATCVPPPLCASPSYVRTRDPCHTHFVRLSRPCSPYQTLSFCFNHRDFTHCSLLIIGNQFPSPFTHLIMDTCLYLIPIHTIQGNSSRWYSRAERRSPAPGMGSFPERGEESDPRSTKPYIHIVFFKFNVTLSISRRFSCAFHYFVATPSF